MGLNSVQREVCELCWALCDGALDEAGFERLESMVCSDALARRTYVEFMFLRGGLLWDKAAAGMPTPLACPAPSSAPRIPVRRRWGLAAAGLAAALLLGLGIWGLRPADRGALPLAAAPPGIVLTREYQARWQGFTSPVAGQPLRAGRWTLSQGQIEVRWPLGSRVVIEGPAVFDIASDHRIGLQSGRLTADVREPGGLRLDTPLATIVDVGTRFAVQSDPRQIDVHVTEGFVDVRTKSDGIESADATRLAAGQACRIASGDRQPRPLDPQPERFVWEVPLGAPGDPDLLAYEGFAYRGPLLAAGDGGWGWSRGWAGFDDFSRPSTALLVDHASLTCEALNHLSQGGHVAEDVNDWGFRELARPLDLSLDRDYYVSFLFRKLNPGRPGQGRWAGLSLFEGPSERVFFGTQDGGFRIAQLGQSVERGELEPGVVYFFVAKLAARARDPDQAFLHVFAPGETIALREPDAWRVEGSRDTRLEGRLDRVRIASETGYAIDEIRIGHSWRAVTRGAAGDPTAISGGAP